MVPPDSPRIPRVRGYSGSCRPASAFAYGAITRYGAASQLLLLASAVPDGSPTTPPQEPGTVWAIPRSLAATRRVSFDFLSCGYLDVSVPRVGSTEVVTTLRSPGFPIRTSPDHRVLARSPRLFAGSYVLHRLLPPRHPPRALHCFKCQGHSSVTHIHELTARQTCPTQRLPFHPSSSCQRAGRTRQCLERPKLPGTAGPSSERQIVNGD